MNILGLWLLHPGREANINVQGAWLHVLADLLGSFAALAGGALIWMFGWSWADPVASALISLLIIYSSWALLKDAIAILMEGTPGHVDLDEVRKCICTVPGVQDVHDLHVWTITSGMEALVGACGRGRRTPCRGPARRATEAVARSLRDRPHHDPGRAPQFRRMPHALLECGRQRERWPRNAII